MTTKHNFISHIGSLDSAVSLKFESLEHRNLLAVNPFALEDVNPTSATHGQMVSPNDFAGQTSAYYFGSAT